VDLLPTEDLPSRLEEEEIPSGTQPDLLISRSDVSGITECLVQDIVDGCLTTSLTPQIRGVSDVVGSARGHAVRIEGRTKAEVARDYRVSRQWVHELVRRFDAEGEAARSRVRHSLKL
jgi:hypothetical protein